MTKRKLERFAEMKTFPNVTEPKFHEVFQTDYKLKGQWKTEFFKNKNPIILELGCGKGEYTVNLARHFPGINFIGIDIKGARMWRGAKQALENNITNAHFLRTRIDFITSLFAENEIDEIWITFPDPQPKKARKRLISAMFLSRYQHFLKHNGIVHLKTDNTDLYFYAKKVVKFNNLSIIHDLNDVHSNTDENIKMLHEIKTFYEQQFIQQNKKIKYLAFKLDKKKTLKEPEDD
ncbi:MAG: tRNA (guanosine(46)-N7)-methyltransferase TrmB [Bacteroidales bacterium]